MTANVMQAYILRFMPDPSEQTAIASPTPHSIIPSQRVRYLSEIAESNRNYDRWVQEQAALATQLYQFAGVMDMIKGHASEETMSQLLATKTGLEARLDRSCKDLVAQWPAVQKKYAADFFEYQVRDKLIRLPLTALSLSGTRIHKVLLPAYKDWGDLLRWQLQENVPGLFPFTAGVFDP